jgi:hypothetical protein
MKLKLGTWRYANAHFDISSSAKYGAGYAHKTGTLTPRTQYRRQNHHCASFPLDPRIRAVKVQGRSTKFVTNVIGDVQRAEGYARCR